MPGRLVCSQIQSNRGIVVPLPCISVGTTTPMVLCIWEDNFPGTKQQAWGRRRKQCVAAQAATHCECCWQQRQWLHDPIHARIEEERSAGGSDDRYVSRFLPSVPQFVAPGQEQLFFWMDLKSCKICCFPRPLQGHLTPRVPVFLVKKQRDKAHIILR